MPSLNESFVEDAALGHRLQPHQFRILATLRDSGAAGLPNLLSGKLSVGEIGRDAEVAV